MRAFAALAALLSLVIVGPIMGGALAQNSIEWDDQNGAEQEPMRFAENVLVIDAAVYGCSKVPMLESRENILSNGNWVAGCVINGAHLHHGRSVGSYKGIFDFGEFIVSKVRFVALGDILSNCDNLDVQSGCFARIFKINFNFEHLSNRRNAWRGSNVYYAEPSALIELQRCIRLRQLLGRIFVGIYQGPIENQISASGENHSEDKQSYRNYLTTCTLIIVSLLLTLSAFKSISYAVYRNKVLFVLFALLLQTGAVAAVLYVIGFFTPFPH